ncbi:MAG: PepSY domain-containing protein [Verrucomicrobiales bacterium]|nr:PepSY domain-containing protein [Verrucomicrobiales bacterium]
MTLRSAIFWLHLVAGTVAGAIILILCVTGVALAFEKEFLAWAERDQRRITSPSPTAASLNLDDQIARARELRSGTMPSAITVFAAPNATTLVTFGRDDVLYLDPYSGSLVGHGSPNIRLFLKTLIEWHRWLGASGDHQATGKAVTGVANLIFLGLAFSGLVLWWPKPWSTARLRSTLLPDLRATGKARDWNWHHAFGFWSTPFLIVLTVTAVPISYRWAGEWIERTFASSPATSADSAKTNARDHERVIANASAPQRSREADLRIVKQQIADWEQITLRLTAAGSRRGGPSATTVPPENTATSNFAVMTKGQRPRFISQQITVDSSTGDIVRRENYANQSTARKVRSWMRFLHTGEALGIAGKTAAAAASLAGVLLVWTGLALALRRWSAWRRRRRAISMS